MSDLSRLSFHSADIDEILIRLKAKEKCEKDIHYLGGAPFRGEVQGIFSPHLILCAIHLNGHIEQTSRNRPGFIEMNVPLTDSVDFHWNRNEEIGHQHIAFFPNGGECEILVKDSIRILNVKLHHDAVRRHLMATGDNPSWIKSSEPHVQRLEPMELERFRQRLLDLHSSLFMKEEENLSLSDIEEAGREVVRAACDQFSDRHFRAEKLFPSAKAKLVSHFREYLESHDHSQARVSDFCRQEKASLRSLEYATRALVWLSPKQYMKAYYLNKVRRALTESHEPIHEIAGRLGFWHMGQLSKDYRRLFGELPSEKCGR